MILRELLIMLGLDIDEASFAKGQIAADLVKASFEKLVETGKELVHQFVENVEEVAEMGHKLEKLAQQTGLEVNELQDLASAAGASGIDMDSLGNSLGILARNMFAAKNGSEEAEKSFSRLGIKTKKADGTLRSAGDVLLDLSDHFSTMPDSVEKTGQAMSLLGRQGKDLIPFLNKGREGIAELAAETPNLTEEQIKAGTELVHTQKRIAAETAAMWQRAVAPLLPEITKLLKWWLAWKKANAAIMTQRLQAFVGGVVKVFKILADTFELVDQNGTAVLIMAGLLTTAFIAMNAASVAAAISAAAAWIVAAAPFIAIAAAVGVILLLLDDIRGFKEGEDSLTGDFVEMLEDWRKPKEGDTWFITAIRDFLGLIIKTVQVMDQFGSKVVDKFHSIADVIKYLPPVLIGRLAYGLGEKIGEQFGDDANYQDSAGLKGSRYTGKQNNSQFNGGSPYQKYPTDPYANSFQEGNVPAGSGPMMPQASKPLYPAPEYRSQTGGAAGAGVLVQAPTQITIHQRPDESNQDLVDRLKGIARDTFTESFSTELQQAVGSVGK